MTSMSAHAAPAFELTQSPPSTNGKSLYNPISSVWEGTDDELIEAMLNFYPTIPPSPILDATHNAGRFWKRSKRRVVSMDIDRRYKPDIVSAVDIHRYDSTFASLPKPAGVMSRVQNRTRWNRRIKVKHRFDQLVIRAFPNATDRVV